MKLLHLSDLHIGKRVNEFSMIDDQKYILTKIINIVDEEKPDGILIAGDVYDKAVPSAEAVELLDEFLVKLYKREIPTFIISGNHDSADRLAFASKLIDLSGIHFSPVFDGTVSSFEMGENVCIYMLPFVKPVIVRPYFPDEIIDNYTDAVRIALSRADIDATKTNILLAHQFVTGAVTSESEELSVGGLDNVDASVFDAFDYVALGHIHGPQKIQRDTIRYSGTPLKYSFSECNHKKSVTVLNIEGKNINISTRELLPKNDMREIRGEYNTLVSKSFYEGTNTNDYIRAILTDEEEIPGVMDKLRVVYPNIMLLGYDNTRSRSKATVSTLQNIEKRKPIDLFDELFELQNGRKMTEEQREFSNRLIESIWEGDK